MGYRLYIGSIDKQEYRNIRSLSLDELYKYKGIADTPDPYISGFELLDELHCFGSLEFDTRPYHLNFFLHPETLEHYTDEHDFWIVGREFLLRVIEYYTQVVKETYRNNLAPFYDESTPELMSSQTASRDENMNVVGHLDLSLATPKQNSAIASLIAYNVNFAREWGVRFDNIIMPYRPYNLDSDSKVVVDSWKYEYVVFEMVAILKMFDWKQKNMVLYGF